MELQRAKRIVRQWFSNADIREKSRWLRELLRPTSFSQANTLFNAVKQIKKEKNKETNPYPPEFLAIMNKKTEIGIQCSPCEVPVSKMSASMVNLAPASSSTSVAKPLGPKVKLTCAVDVEHVSLWPKYEKGPNIKAAAWIGIYWENGTQQEWKIHRKPSECVPNPFTRNILVGFDGADGKLLDGKPIEQVRNEVAVALYGHKVVTFGPDDIRDIFGYEQEWQQFVEEMDHIDIQSDHFFDYVDFDLKYQYYMASDPDDIDPAKVREDIKKGGWIERTKRVHGLKNCVHYYVKKKTGKESTFQTGKHNPIEDAFWTLRLYKLMLEHKENGCGIEDCDVFGHYDIPRPKRKKK